ncbi:MAG: 6-bladed beta-propeller [Gemmatimonadales bacterium]|jgi:hypothetical protein
MNRRLPEPFTIALLALALAACASDAERSTSTVSDSAGVTIVESRGPTWGPEDAWRLSDAPLVTIGTVEGADEYQLYRVSSARRLADGRIVIANAGTNELRFYDAGGTYLFTRGGEGGGPGEFRSLSTIWILDDSLYLFDYNQLRVTVYSTAGEFARTFRVRETPDGGFPFPEGVLAPHSLLVRRSPPDAELNAGFNRDTSLYMRYTLDGEPLDSLGWFPGDESYFGTTEDFSYGTSAPYGLRAYMLAAGDLLYYGSSDKYEIEVRDSDGTLQRLIRRPIPNEPVTAEEVEEFQRNLEERQERMPPIWRNMYSQMTLPETKPAYGRLLVDSEGNLWVADYARERNDEGTWSVFDPEGRFLGSVETPTGGRVLQIGSDFVLGVWRDELDVEYMRLYELIKN